MTTKIDLDLDLASEKGENIWRANEKAQSRCWHCTMLSLSGGGGGKRQADGDEFGAFAIEDEIADDNTTQASAATLPPPARHAAAQRQPTARPCTAWRDLPFLPSAGSWGPDPSNQRGLRSVSVRMCQLLQQKGQADERTE